MEEMKPDTETLTAASTFRKFRAFCRTMQKGQWYLDEILAIRCRSRLSEHPHCPLSFVGGTRDYTNWQIASRKLGFTHKEYTEIIAASDHNRPSIKMRRILLRAAGLREARA